MPPRNPKPERRNPVAAPPAPLSTQMMPVIDEAGVADFTHLVPSSGWANNPEIDRMTGDTPKPPIWRQRDEQLGEFHLRASRLLVSWEAEIATLERAIKDADRDLNGLRGHDDETLEARAAVRFRIAAQTGRLELL